MTKYIKQQDTFNIIPGGKDSIFDEVPMGSYVVKFNMDTGQYYLEIVADTAIGKIYGDIQPVADRMFKTFMDRPHTTGLLLSGEKGSGKTMLAKVLSSMGRENGVITVIINQAFKDKGFNAFIQRIEQPCILVFDEFDKTYEDQRDQNELLSLLDGMFQTKKLIVLTCNELQRVNKYMLNRPGRLFYHKSYEGLDDSFIVEYCTDVLHDKTHMDDIRKVAAFVKPFNFDMLKAVVEEVNRFKIPVREVIGLLNIDLSSTRSRYKSKVFHKGVLMPDWTHGEHHNIDPTSPFDIFNNKLEDSDGRSPEVSKLLQDLGLGHRDSLLVEPKDLRAINGETRTYVVGDWTVEMTRVIESKVTLENMLSNT